MLALVTDDGRIAVTAYAPHASPNGRWKPVVDTPRPADTATHKHVYSLQLVGGTPTVVWIEQPWTAAESTELQRSTNEAELRDRIRQALASNAASITSATDGPIAAFVALTDDLPGLPAAIKQNRQAIDWLIGRNIAQERQLTALIRLVVAADLLDDIEDAT